MLIFCFQKIQLSCFSIGMISIEDHANKLINIKNYIHIIFSVVYDGFLTVFFGLILSDRIIILFILISQSSRIMQLLLVLFLSKKQNHAKPSKLKS